MKRILFVDDEVRILDGLKRLLRAQRQEWEMVFAEGGVLALQELAVAPFDVIVTDMRMPGMDGAALLAQVQQKYPHLARVVLSGHTELEAALRAVPVAHQFLSKPCEADDLRAVIERACNLQSLLSNEELRAAISQMGDLPSLPRRFQELTAALDNPDITLPEIARIIERDVAMCAKCLQLVNSAFFGLPRRVTSIQPAITYLGTNMLRNLVFSAEVFRTFAPGSSLSEAALEALEAHALEAARLTRHFGLERKRGEEAFMAAMLHDIGRLVLESRLPARCREVRELARQQDLSLSEAERAILGVTHAQVGAFLLGLWGLPYPIVEAVALHHQEPCGKPEDGDLVPVVQLAERLADARTPSEARERLEPLDSIELEAFGFGEAVSALWWDVAPEPATR